MCFWLASGFSKIIKHLILFKLNQIVCIEHQNKKKIPDPCKQSF